MRKILILSMAALLVTDTAATPCTPNAPNKPTTVLNTDKTVTITWNLLPNTCLPLNFQIQSSTDSGATWNILHTVASDTFLFNTNILPAGRYIFQVGSGYESSGITDYMYSVSSTPPIVIANTPDSITIFRLPATIYVGDVLQIGGLATTSSSPGINVFVTQDTTDVAGVTEIITPPFTVLYSLPVTPKQPGNYQITAELNPPSKALATASFTAVVKPVNPVFSCTFFS